MTFSTFSEKFKLIDIAAELNYAYFKCRHVEETIIFCSNRITAVLADLLTVCY